MGKVTLASLESIKGRVGNISYYWWKKRLMNRKASAERSAEWKDEQLEQQACFGTLIMFTKRMKEAIRTGFPNPPTKWSAPNTFINRNMGAVTATTTVDESGKKIHPVTVDYEAMTWAEGYLAPPSVTVSRDEGSGTLSFTLAAQEEGYDCHEDDVVRVLVLSAGARVRQIFQELGARGDGGMVTVSVPAYMDGELHVYVFATTADGKEASDSEYLPLA